MSDAPGSRERAERTDAGVMACVDLMVEGKWVPGRSYREIAHRFEVSPRTAENWATNASRLVRMAVDADADGIRARLLTTLASVLADARIDRDHKACVAAVAETSRLLDLAERRRASELGQTTTREQTVALLESLLSAARSGDAG